MTQPDDAFSGPDPWEDLRDTGSAHFREAYFQYRPHGIRAVVASGGSQADGPVFYRVAFIHAANLLQTGNQPENTPLSEFLEALAVQHYRDWRLERNVEFDVEPQQNARVPAEHLPTSDSMRPLRHAIWARRQFFRLSKEYRYQVQELADDAAQSPDARRFTTEADAVAEGYGASLIAYKNLLKDYWDIWEEVLPSWVVTALTDISFAQVWDQTQLFEQQHNRVGEATPPVSHFWRNAFIVLGIITLLALAAQWFMRPKTPDEVYSDNFSAPKSLLADLAAKQANSPDNDSLGIRNETCNQAFADADDAYQTEDYQAAASALTEILRDSSKVCHSDAYFYLAIIGLHLDEPGLTIECLSNIEDLSRYGEDIYWYQALAFVKMATKNPMMQDKAARAVTRVISNTEIPERREQAEKMLEQLND